MLGSVYLSVAVALTRTIGIAAANLCSLVIERFTFRYLQTKYGDSSEHAIPLVSSLGFLLVLENLLRIACGGDAQRFRGPTGDLTAEFEGLVFRGGRS